MKRFKLRNDLLEKVLIHAKELSSQKLLNDIKPGGSFYVFLSDFNFANENEIQFTDHDISFFRSLILDYIDNQTIQYYYSKIDFQSIDFEMDENKVNQFLLETSDQIKDNGIKIETCLIDFVYKRLISIYYIYSNIDNSCRILNLKFNNWLKDSDVNRKSTQNQNSVEFITDPEQKQTFEIFEHSKQQPSENDKSSNQSFTCALKMKTNALIQEFEVILIAFFDSIDEEIEYKSSRNYISFVEDRDAFMSFLLLKDLEKEIVYNVDTSVFSKFLLSIYKFYEKDSIKHMINKNKFTSNKTKNFLKLENYIKNQSRSKKIHKYRQCFLDLDYKLKVFEAKIPNF